MKVTNTGPSTVDKAGTSSAITSSSEKKRRGGSATEIDAGVSDKVAISGRARDAAKAKELASAAPDVNEDKVAQLRAAIAKGAYKVDADAIADRMVDEHLNTMF